MRTGPVLSASLLAAALLVASGAAARAEILVDIDKTTQRMTVTVDGQTRYVWPVSTGRPGYDTPNGTFRPNRMDADHLSQEWDNAPMPHAIFFDMAGHAIHGFFDVKHLGSAVSHGCVRLAPEHAAILYDLVSREGMNQTKVVVTGRTPAGRMPEVARRSGAVREALAPPMQIAPGYDQAPGYAAPPFGAPPANGYDRQPQPDAWLAPPGYARQSYDGPPSYDGAPAYPQPHFFLLAPDGRY
jgi:hypothetical protein